ncbi:MAG TPA: glycosyl hydrolase family 43, partial [Clostridiales bacterium]|nr:glycosyl hydrolase family 43 [Clostridiales bacterium]
MKKLAFNPFLPLHEYIPDGEPHVLGDRLYLFGSHDREGGTQYCELDYVVWSAPLDDLADWRCEGEIYQAKQDPLWTAERRYMYAPDVVRGPDGRYYLYYSLEGAGEGMNGPISVAVCNEPAGRYLFYGIVQNPDGSVFRRYLPGDPAVINDDGVIRLYYGWSLSMVAAAAHGQKTEATLPASIPREQLIQAEMMLFKRSRENLMSETEDVMGANTVVLGDDMLTVSSDPVRIVPGQFAAAGTSFTGHAFYEASSIRKIGDLYYFIYSSELSHELCYATSCEPDRNFVYGGTIISNGDVGYQGRLQADRLNMTANNHGSLVQVNGQWYVFYHRQTHNSTYSRQACAEPVTIGADGSIAQVEMTSCGLNGGPLPAYGQYPAAICCNLTNGRMPHVTNRILAADIPFIAHGEGQQHITNIKQGTLIGYKYFDFNGSVRLTLSVRGSGNGQFIVRSGEGEVGRIAVAPSEGWQDLSTLITARGVQALFLVYEGV